MLSLSGRIKRTDWQKHTSLIIVLVPILIGTETGPGSHGAQKGRAPVCLLHNASMLILSHAFRFLSSTLLWVIASCFFEFRLLWQGTFCFLFLCSGFPLKKKKKTAIEFHASQGDLNHHYSTTKYH